MTSRRPESRPRPALRRSRRRLPVPERTLDEVFRLVEEIRDLRKSLRPVRSRN